MDEDEVKDEVEDKNEDEIKKEKDEIKKEIKKNLSIFKHIELPREENTCWLRLRTCFQKSERK